MILAEQRVLLDGGARSDVFSFYRKKLSRQEFRGGHSSAPLPTRPSLPSFPSFPTTVLFTSKGLAAFEKISKLTTEELEKLREIYNAELGEEETLKRM